MIARVAAARACPTALLTLLLLATVILLGAGGPASAHASLVRSDPAQGAVLPEVPDRVRFTFTEAVGVVPDGVQVFDAAGGSVASSASVKGDELAVTIEDQVGQGTLVVVWRVISEDGHPVSGSLSFSVGAPSAQVAPPPSNAASSTDAPLALKLLRWVGYVGLLLAVGLVAFLLLMLPRHDAADVARRRGVRLARYGAAVAAVAWLAALPLTALYQVGGDVGSLASRATWSSLAPAEYGVATAVVLGVGLAAVLLVDGRPGRPLQVAAIAAAFLAAAAPAFTGHTRAARPELLAVAADVLHLVAGSIWFGGLVALVVMLPALLANGVVAAEVLARFSGVAAGVLAALVVTGSVLAWRIVGSWADLVGTTYGQLLLLKVATAAIAVAVAAWNRYALLPRMHREARNDRQRRTGNLVVRAARTEVGALVAVLLLTGILVDRSPEADAAASTPEVQTAMLGAFTVEATMSPLAAGPTEITIETRDAAGEPVEGLEAPKAMLSSGAVDLGAMELSNIGPGTYTGKAVLPSAGTWRLQVSLRIGEFDNPVTVLEFDVPED